MRIVFYYFKGGGGGLSNLLELVRSIATQEKESQLYVVSWLQADFSRLSDLSNVRVVPMRSRLPSEAVRLYYGLYGLNKFARDIDADIIWSINTGAYIKGRIPQVLSINNAYQVYPWRHSALHPAGFLRFVALRLFSGLSISAADLVLAQTSHMASLLEAKKAGCVRVLPKAVGWGSQNEGPNQAAESDSVASTGARGWFTFVYVATLLPHKNHGAIIGALEILRKEGKNIRVVTTLNQAELVGQFGGAARELINEGRLVAAGWVEPQRLRQLYESCDASINPSKIESLSSSHLEAMEWRRPLIASDLPYARDLCGDAAVFVDPESTADIASAMSMLANNHSLRSSLVSNGQEIMKKFSRNWAEVGREALAIFECVVLSKNG